MFDPSPFARMMNRNKGRGEFRADLSGATPTLWVYDQLVANQSDADWFGGVASDTFGQALAAIDAPAIDVRVNSPGGDVGAGVAMAQAMRNHSATITVHVDGYAASAASFLLTAADHSVIAPGAFVMIHNAWSIVGGNAADMRQRADTLDQLDASIAQGYAAAWGGTLESWAALMNAESWFGADDAVAAGMVKAVATGAKKAANVWDLSAYKRAPVEPLLPPVPAAPANAITVTLNIDSSAALAVVSAHAIETETLIAAQRKRVAAHLALI
jgi:ATP-dependent Clp protease protease subunit